MKHNEQAGLERELTPREAADVLGVSRHTVYRLIRDGALEARSAGLPNSRRPNYRILEREVIELRTSFTRQKRSHQRPGSRKAQKLITTNSLKYIRLN